jgi:hypothetical protein
MRRVLTVLGLILLLAFVGLSNGCILIGAGIGVGVAHAVADEADHFDRPIAEVEVAAQKALELIGGTYHETERTKDGVKIKGRLHIEDENEKVVIGVWDKGEDPTKVEVRIGTFGYEDASKEILALIGSELGVQGVKEARKAAETEKDAEEDEKGQ